MKKKYKPQPKKNFIEYKPRRGRWKKAELISIDKLDRAIIRLEDGNIIKRTTLKGFHWGVVKRKKKRGM